MSTSGKLLQSSIKLIVPAGGAKPAPPVGPAIGQAGLNLMQFCKDFNARTEKYVPETPMRCQIRAFRDKSYEFTVKTPRTSWFIKRCAGVEKSSQQPGHKVQGVITLKHVYHIAAVKQADQPNMSLRAWCESILAQCKSMGIAVVRDEAAAKAFPRDGSMPAAGS
ncbi:unnamed protein product [Pedinophyceae sp. YPF-701]|nr:unnamed protein product [Pedinophyceae sp. YPF-701]